MQYNENANTMKQHIDQTSLRLDNHKQKFKSSSIMKTTTKHLLATYFVLTFSVATCDFSGPVVLRYCNGKRDCGASFGYLCGQNQTCYCDRYYILNDYGDKCVGGVGQKCRYDEHCIEGAFCEYQMKCECKEEMVVAENGLACSRSKQKSSCVVLYHCAIVVMLLHVLKFA